MRRRQTMRGEGLRRLGSSDDASSQCIWTSHRIPQLVPSSETPIHVSSGWIEVDSSVDEAELRKVVIEGLQKSEAESKEMTVKYASLPKTKEEAPSHSPSYHCVPVLQLNPSPPVKDKKQSTITEHVVSNGGCIWAPESEIVLQNPQSNDMSVSQESKNQHQGNGNALPIVCSHHEKEIKKLKVLLHKEREISANVKLQLEEKHKLNESTLEELHYLKMEKEKEKEQMTHSARQFEKNLIDTCDERDQIQAELTRFKEQMLDKELEKSEKMVAENKIITELLNDSEYQKSRIVDLEKVLKHEAAKFEEMERIKDDEIQKLSEIIISLNQKLENCIKTITSKNSELLNLQCTLQQYNADTESKKLLEMNLALSREESAKLSELLKVANEEVDKYRSEKNEICSKLLENEKMASQGKCTIQNLQEENAKLHKRVEQSMMKLNKMSTDFSYFVDRRIIIKLLITYFQKNHCKEVLNLIVRILGFSEEDKKRIGFARETAGKMVSGVFGLPNFLAGGIFKGSVPRISSQEHSETQSFGDLWVDFLLKEGDQRNKREADEDEATPSFSQEESSSIQSATLDS